MPRTSRTLDHLLDLDSPVATVVVCAPPASEDSDDRRALRGKEIRTELEAAGASAEVIDGVVAAVSRGAASGWQPGDWLGVVASDDDVTVFPMVDGRSEVVSFGSLPRFVPFLRDRVRAPPSPRRDV